MKGISNRQKPAWLTVRKSGKKSLTSPRYNRPGWNKKQEKGSQKGA